MTKKLEDFGSVSVVARMVGVKPQTLHAAVRIGLVQVDRLGCGSLVVLIESARQWSVSPRRRGRKKSQKLSRTTRVKNEVKPG